VKRDLYGREIYAHEPEENVESKSGQPLKEMMPLYGSRSSYSKPNPDALLSRRGVVSGVFVDRAEPVTPDRGVFVNANLDADQTPIMEVI